MLSAWSNRIGTCRWLSRFVSVKEISALQRLFASLSKSTEQRLPCWSTKPEMGNRYFIYQNRTGLLVSVHHPRSVWQQYRCIQDRYRAKHSSCPEYAQRSPEKRKCHCRVAAPQWPRLSIHLTSIFPPDSIIRHYAVNVKTWKSIWQCFSGKLFLNPENRVCLPGEAAHLWGGAPPHRWLHPLLQLPAHPTQNKTDTDGIPMPVHCLTI